MARICTSPKPLSSARPILNRQPKPLLKQHKLNSTKQVGTQLLRPFLGTNRFENRQHPRNNGLACFSEGSQHGFSITRYFSRIRKTNVQPYSLLRPRRTILRRIVAYRDDSIKTLTVKGTE